MPGSTRPGGRRAGARAERARTPRRFTKRPRAAAGRAIAWAAIAAALASCGRGKTDAEVPGELLWTDTAPSIAARFPSDARAAAAGPASDPQVLVGRDAILHVSWSTGTADSADLLLATSADLGAHFEAPVRVNPRPGGVSLRAGAGSSDVLMAGDGTILAHWMARGAEAGGPRDLIVARSDDGGATFTAVRADDGPDSTGRWAPSLCAGARGGVWAAWVDERPRAGGAGRRAARAPADGTPSRHVRLARSFDGGRSFEPSVDVMGDGDAEASAASPTSLVARGADLFVAFVMDTTGVTEVCAARSRDGGATFEPPVPLGAIAPSGASGPASAALPGDRWAVAWISPENGGRRLRLLTGAWEDTVVAAPIRIEPTAGDAGQTDPSVAVGGALVVLSWRETAGAGDVFAFAMSHDGGASFGPARRLGQPAQEMSAGPARCAVAGDRHLFFVRPSTPAGPSLARALLPQEGAALLH